MRQNRSARLHLHLLLFAEKGVVFDGVQHRGQLVAQENGHNGRRSLVGAQPVIVSGTGHGDAHEVRVLVHRLDHRHEKYQKLGVGRGGTAGIQQVYASVGDQGPVVVLSGTVDALKGLLVEQAGEAVLVGHLFHHLHGELVVVHRHIGRVEYRSQLVLGRGHLVVFGFGRDPKFPERFVQIVHEGGNTGF